MGGGRPGLQEQILGMRDAAYVLALRLAGSSPAAEDAVQDAYLRALTLLRDGAEPENVRVWLMGLVAGSAKNLLRAEARLKRREAQAAAGAAGGREEAVVDAGALEVREALRVAMRELDADLRAPVALRCEIGLTHAEVAAVLEIPERTARDRAERGLARLRQLLAGMSLALAPAIIEKSLAAGLLEHAPESLVRALDGLKVAGGAKTAAVAAAKGGIAMKVIVGVVLAGALAGGVALFLRPATGNRPPATNLSSSPAASGPVKVEPYAFAVGQGHLDGPKHEAMSYPAKIGTCDEDGNLFFSSLAATFAQLRCIRADGAVETIACDTFWYNGPLNEGPASFMPRPQPAEYIGGSRASFVAKGRPYAGEDKGCIYAGDGFKPVYRIFKNKAKGDRWWFKQVTSGKDAPPAEVGKSAKLSAVTLDGAMFATNGVTYKGGFYEIDEANDKITCLLTPADYLEKVSALAGKKLSPNSRPIGRFEDGSFIVWWYPAEPPSIFRVSADRGKVELICKDNPGKFDGPGLQSGVFTGPQLGPIVKNTFFIGAIDGGHIRRWHEGRVSTLCLADGEWHEYTTGKDVPRQIIVGRNALIPPNGGCSYLLFPGEVMGTDCRTYKIHPIDWTKPTVGPKVGGE